MSKQVDNRVVSMDFDNRRFESNVNTSMSTLDKLKAKLNFGKSSKGLDGLSAGVETATAKFSALQVMGVTALANITNSAVNAGKRIVSALTIDPVKDGWQEYEMTLNAVQTTMAATGKTAEEVEKELKKLDEYADKTVYGTADMLNNLPKFTNAGVDLEKATTAMIGIANATALAGGDASKASIAFYNLGQAIGTGYLTRMDYNSINNAGIATMQWKEQMVDAAIAAGTLKKVGDDAYQAGNKTMTLQQLFIDGLQEQWATTDVMMKVFGDYGDEQTAIGKKAYAAAQDIKTFTQMMESLKATAGTGWKDTWQIVFGGLDDAKEFWTGLTNTISGALTKMSDIRNKFLDLVLNGNPLSSMLGILDNLNGFKDLADGADGAAKSLDYYQKMFKKIWRGDYKNQPYRFGLLDAEGHDHRVLQDLVDYSDKVMGYGKGWKYTLTMEDVNRSLKKYGVTVKDTNVTVEEQKQILQSLTDEQLKQAGMTEEQIRLYRELEKESKRTGKSMKEIIELMTTKTGRTLLIESFKNIGKMFSGIASSIKKAFNEIFNPPSMESMAFALYRLISAFHKFTERLVLNESKMDKLKRTFAGVFAIVRIFTNLLGGGLKIVFKIIAALLQAFNLDILDVTASVGDALVAFSDWVDRSLDFTKIFKVMAPYLKTAAKVIVEFVKSCAPLDKIVKYFKNLGTSITEWFKGIKDAENIPKYIIQGLAKGLRNGVKIVWDAITYLGTALIEKFKEIFQIHSPSVIFMALGGFIIAGLAIGILKGIPGLGDTIKKGVSGVVDTLKSIDWGQIFSAIIAIGLIAIGFKLTNAIENLVSPLDSLCDALDGLKMYLQAQAMKQIAISIAILAGSLVVLSFVPAGKLWNAVGVIAALGVILGGLVFVLSKFGSLGTNSAGLGKTILSFVGIAVTLLIVATAFNKVAKMDWKDIINGVKNMSIVILTFGALAAASRLIGPHVGAFGSMILKISIAMWIMVKVAKAAAAIPDKDLTKGVIALSVFSLLIMGMMKASKYLMHDTGITAFGANVLKISIALWLMAKTAKIAGSMNSKDLVKGTVATMVFAGLMMVIMYATTLLRKPKSIDYFSGMILKMGISMLLMAVTAKIAASLSGNDLLKGVAAVLAFSGIVVALMAATRLLTGTRNIDHIGGAILKISLAMGILAALSIVLSFIKIKNLAKGIVAIGLIAGMVSLAMYTSKFVTKNSASLIALTVFVGILSAAMIALSFLDTKKVATAAASISFVLVAMTVLMKSMSVFTKKLNWKSMINPLLVMIGVVAILSGIMWMLSALNVNVPIETAASMALIMMAMAGVMVALQMVTKSMPKTQSLTTLYGIVGAMAALAVPLTLFAAVLNIPIPSNSIEKVKALSLMVGAMTIILFALNTLNKMSMGFKWYKLLETILALTALAVPLALFATILMIPIGSDAFNKVVALSLLCTAMGKMLLSLTMLNKMSVGVKWSSLMKSILALTAMAVPLALFATILMIPVSNNATEKIITLSLICAAMTALLFPLSVLGALMQRIPGGFKYLMSGILALTAMAVPLIAFVGVLAVMQNVGNAMANVQTLSLLVLAMTALLIPLTVLGNFATSALLGVLALTAMAVPLLAFVGILALMQGVQNATANAIALSNLVLAMSIALIPLTLIGTLAAAGALVGVVALTAMAVPLLAFVGILALMQGVKNAEKNANVIISLLEAVSKALVLIGLVSPLLSMAVPAILGLTKVMLLLGALALVVGMLVEACPSIETFIDKGMPVLLKLTKGLGGLIGSIIDGLLDSATKSLPVIGERLAEFMTNLKVFIEGTKTIDDNVAKSTKILLGAITDLFAADFLSNITGMRNLGQLGIELSEFSKNLKPFITNTSNIDISICNGVKALAEAVKILTSANFTESIASWMTGESSLSKFGAEIEGLGVHLAAFIASVGNLDDESVKKADCAASIIKKLAEAADKIPNEGGFAALLFGDNGLGKFAEDVKSTGTAVKNFVAATSGLDKKKVETAGYAADIIVKLSEAADKIPNNGGLSGLIMGENDIKTFGENMPNLAKHIVSFCQNLSGLPENAADSAGFVVDVIKKLASIDIENEGGFVSWWTGDNTIDKFTKHLPDVGTHLGKFAKNLGTFNEDKVNTVDAAIRSIKALTNLAAASQEASMDNLSIFAFALPSVGSGIKNFTDKVTNVGHENVNKAITQTNRVISMAKSVAGTDVNAIKNFGTSLQKAAEDGIKGYVNAFKGKDLKADLTKATESLVNSAVKGVRDKKESVKKAFKELATVGVNAMKTEEMNLKYNAAGKFAAQGFANGINANKYLATAAGSALGKAALTAAKNALDENSPSKEFYKVGDFGGIGFVNALYDNVSDAYKAGGAMADSAKKGLSGAISRITNTLDNEMDMQPTIRPVLDLSDVKSGAGSISSMFSGRTLSISSANVGAVSASMAKRQNGNDNSEIVSGIKALRKDIAGMSNTTYQINGITYDDGSNISSAVETLVRAARIERRT